MISFLHYFLLGVLGFFAGCATTPRVIGASSPASPQAAESPFKARANSLRPDELTRHTRELLRQREDQAAAAGSEPASQPGPKAP